MHNTTFLRYQVENNSRLPWIGKAFRPVTIRIDRTTASKQLYKAEHALHTSLDKAAKAWLTFMGFEDNGKWPTFWTRGIGQALKDLLDSYDHDAAEVAAVAFLESRGYVVTRPKGR